MTSGVVAVKRGSRTGSAYSIEFGVTKKRDTSASVRFRAGMGTHTSSVELARAT